MVFEDDSGLMIVDGVLMLDIVMFVFEVGEVIYECL